MFSGKINIVEQLYWGFAPLFSLLAFGFFSYPSDNIFLASFLPLAVGSIVHDNKAKSGGSLKTIISIIAILIITVLSIHAGTISRQVRKDKAVLIQEYEPDAADRITKYFYSFHSDLKLNTTYLQLAIRHNQIRNEEIFTYVIPNCENWCDIGEIYERNSDYCQAEQYYLSASYMIPTRIRPNYLLWRLYTNTGRDKEAHDMARKILSQPLKTENTFTLRAKQEIWEFLQETVWEK